MRRWALPLLVAACGDGPTLVKTNTAPTVLLTSHADGTVFDAPGEVTFLATATDPESEPGDLTIAWTLDGARVCLDAVVSDLAETVCALDLARGTHVLAVTVTDPDGEQDSQQISLEVEVPNAAPSCGILEPANESTVAPGAPVTLLAEATDPESPGDALIASFTSDLQGPLGTTTPTTTGEITFTTPVLQGGSHLVTLRVEDPDGATCSDAITLAVGQPPVLTVTAPPDDELVDLGAPTTLVVEVSDPDSSAADLAVTWSSDLDGVLDTTPPDAGGVASFTTTELSRGTHVWTATVTDPDGLATSDSRTLHVNGPPTAPGVTISPANPAPGDALTAAISGDAVDAEGDPITYRWVWLRDGAPAGTATTVPAGVVARGEVWEAQAFASDGRLEGPPGSDVVSVGNARPVVTLVTLEPVDPVTGDRLFASAQATDADGDALSYSFDWYVDGTLVQSGPSDVWDGAFRGQDVSVEVTASDAVVGSAPVASPTRSVGNAPPTLDEVTLSPTDPGVADPLTCAGLGFADAEGDADVSRFQWRLDGAIDPRFTSATVPGGSYVRGDRVVCVVTPDDGRDIGTPQSAPAVTFGNTPPEILTASLSPEPAHVRDTLVLQTTTDDADGDTVTVSARWLVNGTAVGTGDVLELSPFARGDTVTLRATPDDGIDDGAMTVLTLVVDNAPPEDVVVTLTPQSPTVGTPIEADFTGVDPDGDPLTASYAWFVNDQPAGTGDTLAPGAFGEGDVIYAAATVSDPDGATAEATSLPVSVGNTPPGAPVVRIDPPVSDTTLSLHCEVFADAVDPDGDPVTYTMTWQVDGVPYTGVTTSADWPGDTVPAARLVPGRWTCTAVPDDGAVIGPAGIDDARVIPPHPDVALASGGGHHCVVLDGGGLVCWGRGGTWLGHGLPGDVGDQPGEVEALVPLPLPAPVTQVAAGPQNTCALLDDGTVRCWGEGQQGLHGQGDTTDRGTPAALSALGGVPLGVGVEVAELEASSHACIRTPDGRVKCWGDNTWGQLGLGDTDHRGDDPGEMGNALPWVDLGTDRRAIDLAVGVDLTCALLDDLSVKCWGRDRSGALGHGGLLGDLGDESQEMGDALPTVDLGPGAVVGLSLADASPCARFADGRTKCWGGNAQGQLGLGDTEARGDDPGEMGSALPSLDVGNGLTVAELALGRDTHCARLDDDSVKCWGRGTAGALGQGDTDARGDDPGELGDALAPLDWTGPLPVALSSTGASTCALLPCGDVRCWGANDAGQLGLGDVRNRGDQPRELGDALPRVDLPGRAAATGTSVCGTWSHTLTVDGDDADWLPEEVFQTSSQASTALMVGWDDTFVYVGTRHPDALTGGDLHWFIAYFGNGTDRAAVVNQPGFRFGIDHNTQQPTLAVEAQAVARTKATLSYDQLAVANYPGGVPFWEGGDFALSSGADGAQLARSGDVIELRIRRDTLGLRQILYLQTQWLFEGSGFESSYAAGPVDMFADGTEDPDYGTFFRFELDHPDGPAAASIEVALP
jgi:alpha-tubulin suppressor-like RCC1 family protein